MNILQGLFCSGRKQPSTVRCCYYFIFTVVNARIIGVRYNTRGNPFVYERIQTGTPACKRTLHWRQRGRQSHRRRQFQIETPEFGSLTE